MRTLLLVVILFAMSGCGNRNDDKVKVYVFSDFEEGTPFKLWVDGALKYDGKFRPGYRTPSYYSDIEIMVAAYTEKSDSTRTFRIQMLDRDTTFIHNMTGVNEISISVLTKGKFLIFDTHDKEAWLFE